MTKRATSRCNGMKWLVATARSNEKLPPLQRTPSRCNEQPVVATTLWPLQRVVATSANTLDTYKRSTSRCNSLQRVVATSLCNDSLAVATACFPKGETSNENGYTQTVPVSLRFCNGRLVQNPLGRTVKSLLSFAGGGFHVGCASALRGRTDRREHDGIERGVGDLKFSLIGPG